MQLENILHPSISQHLHCYHLIKQAPLSLTRTLEREFKLFSQLQPLLWCQCHPLAVVRVSFLRHKSDPIILWFKISSLVSHHRINSQALHSMSPAFLSHFSPFSPQSLPSSAFFPSPSDSPSILLSGTFYFLFLQEHFYP